MKSTFIGNYKDLNGDTVRVVFENSRYFYERLTGGHDEWISDRPPEDHLDLSPIFVI